MRESPFHTYSFGGSTVGYARFQMQSAGGHIASVRGILFCLRCKGSKVTVILYPSNHGNQECLRLRGLRGSVTFDPASPACKAWRATKCAIRLLAAFHDTDIHACWASRCRCRCQCRGMRPLLAGFMCHLVYVYVSRLYTRLICGRRV